MNIKVTTYNGSRITFDYMGECIFDRTNQLIYLKSILGNDHEVTIPMEAVKTILISEQEETE